MNSERGIEASWWIIRLDIRGKFSHLTLRKWHAKLWTPKKKNQFHILFPFSADQRKNYFTYKTIQAGQFFRLTFTRFVHAKCGNYCAASQSSIPNETKGINKNKNTEEAFSFRPISVSRHASQLHIHAFPTECCVRPCPVSYCKYRNKINGYFG